jgi:hypothetical protein
MVPGQLKSQIICTKELTTRRRHSEDSANEALRLAGLAIARSVMEKRALTQNVTT